MKIGTIFNLMVSLVILSCGSKNNHFESDKISGTYVREYTFKIIHPESGIEIGMRTIRDTIIIQPINTGYEVSNNRWSLNDYDKDGWRNMEHADDRPFPMYAATYEPKTHSLRAVGTISNIIYLNIELNQLYRTKDKPYKKVDVDQIISL
jgi:hypothetical protein